MRVEHYHPLDGTTAEILYHIVWGDIISKNSHINQERPISSRMEAWVAFLDEMPVAIQVVEPLDAATGEVYQVISWTHPQHRRKGIFTQLNAAVDMNLSERGYKYYTSYVVGSEPEMLQAVLARGGTVIEYKCRRPVYTKDELDEHNI